jgi:methyltransferase (TIGR00027 family)
MDDLLSEELEKGLQQLVILGAGFDSRAYRFERLRQGVKVFEVDHPATQKKKMQKLERVLGSEGLPPSMTFVPVDFTRDSLADRLRQCGYSERLKTLFIWEGVTPYLDAAAVDRTLAFVVGHAAPGSSIVFDYMCEPPVTPKRDAVILLVSFLRRLVDELRGFEIDRQQIEAYLLSRGFHRVDTITAADLQARYCIGPNTGRAVSSGYAIAVGVV